MVDRKHFLLVGLRNPEPYYSRTRHNVGANILFALASNFPSSSSSWIIREEVVKRCLTVSEIDLTLAMSNLSMNDNGKAIKVLFLDLIQSTSSNGFSLGNLIIIHDDLDLPFGKLRIKKGGSYGGHRGVKSVMEKLGSTDFIRLKIGVGRPPLGVLPIDYVLSPFSPEEKIQLPSIYNKAVEAINLIIFEGLEKAQNIINVNEGDANESF
jgi:peptidyl-tRNA hydrolase, PTH1 family